MLRSTTPIIEPAGAPIPDAVGEDELPDLIAEWEEAKRDELLATERRKAIEDRLATRITAPELGQKTHRIGDIRVERRNTAYVSGDAAKAEELKTILELPFSLVKPTVYDTAVLKLRKERPEDFSIAVQDGIVKFTLARPQFKITRDNTRG